MEGPHTEGFIQEARYISPDKNQKGPLIMHGMKPMELSAFFRRLHGRGETVTTLAEKMQTNRAHLTQVLNGSRARYLPNGKPTGTWKRLIDHLDIEERALLRSVPVVPRGRKLHLLEAV